MNKTVVFLLGLFLGVILVVVLCKTGNMSLDSKCKHDFLLFHNYTLRLMKDCIFEKDTYFRYKQNHYCSYSILIIALIQR